METENKKQMTSTEFTRSINGFFGTSNYYEMKANEHLKLLLTDGCEWVRETLDAYWLFQEILYSQVRLEIQNLSFQVWILWLDKDEDGEYWVLRCEDGDKDVAMVQMLLNDVTFPVEDFRVFVVDGVVMLPSEY